MEGDDFDDGLFLAIVVKVGRVVVELAMDVRRAAVDASNDVPMVLDVKVGTDGLSLPGDHNKL